MSKIYIVRNAKGELTSHELQNVKVVYAFDEKALAEKWCAQLNNCETGHRIEAISDFEFRQFTIPALREALVLAVMFNFLPNQALNSETYSLDIARPGNPRTFDFQQQRWVTAKEARQARKQPK